MAEKLTRVRVLPSRVVSMPGGRCVAAGEVIALDAAEAKALVEQGFAVKVSGRDSPQEIPQGGGA